MGCTGLIHAVVNVGNVVVTGDAQEYCFCAFMSEYSVTFVVGSFWTIATSEKYRKNKQAI